MDTYSGGTKESFQNTIHPFLDSLCIIYTNAHDYSHGKLVRSFNVKSRNFPCKTVICKLQTVICLTFGLNSGQYLTWIIFSAFGFNIFKISDLLRSILPYRYVIWAK